MTRWEWTSLALALGGLAAASAGFLLIGDAPPGVSLAGLALGAVAIAAALVVAELAP